MRFAVFLDGESGSGSGRAASEVNALLWKSNPARPVWIARYGGRFLIYENRPSELVAAIWLPPEEER